MVHTGLRESAPYSVPAASCVNSNSDFYAIHAECRTCKYNGGKEAAAASAVLHAKSCRIYARLRTQFDMHFVHLLTMPMHIEKPFVPVLIVSTLSRFLFRADHGRGRSEVGRPRNGFNPKRPSASEHFTVQVPTVVLRCVVLNVNFFVALSCLALCA